MMEENATNTENQTTSLPDLNVYCLLRIFKMLPLMDKMHCALTCQSLLNFYIEEITPSYQRFSKDVILTISKMTKANLQQFLEATAQFIEKVDISNAELDASILVALFHYGINIEQVNVTNCELTDDVTRELANLSKLKMLRLDGNLITGKYLASLVELEELYLAENCLDPTYVKDIVKNCTKLRILDIRDFQMDIETSCVIREHCYKLETLRFRNDDADFSELAKLKNLRGLMINNVKQPFLRVLAEHKAEQIEDLRIVAYILERPLMGDIMKFTNLKVFYCEAENAKESLKLLCNLNKLEKLAIVGGKRLHDETLLNTIKVCTNLTYMALVEFPIITEYFIFKAINLLKERRAERKEQNQSKCKPFVLVSTNVDELIFENKQYHEASSILKLYKITDLLSCDFPDSFPFDENN